MSAKAMKVPPFAPPIDEWTSAQTEYRPSFSADLAGRSVEMTCETAGAVRLVFRDDHRLDRSFDGGSPAPLTYDATLIRPGIYLVEFFDPDWPLDGAVPGFERLVTWALDLEGGAATVAVSCAVLSPSPRQGALLRARTAHQFWSADSSAEPHRQTSGMVGSRVIWRYSETDEYEHVYLNSSAFAWQCLRGSERGLSELDPSRAYEIADDLYFFHWAETELVVETALFVDLRDLKTFGRFYVLDTDEWRVVHHQFGARGELVGRVEYPASADAHPA